jgi:hypothetical protein
VRRAVVALLALMVAGGACARKHVLNPLPDVASIKIENGAEFTRTPDVVVLVVAGGFEQVRLAETTGALAASAYRAISAADTARFRVTGADGTKRVYAQFLDDQAGAESSVVSDDIVLDRAGVVDSLSHSAGAVPRTAGYVIHFRLRTAGELDGSAAVDIGTARTGIELFDDGTRGDTQPADGIYETNYTVEATYDAIAAPVTGRFTDRAGNLATPVQAPVLITINNPPPAVTLQSAIPQGGGRVLLQWSQSGAADFQAYRVWHARTSPVLSAPIHSLDSTIAVRTATTFTTVSLAVGVSQLFLVEVVDNAGNASASNELAATPTVAEAPAAPASRVRKARAGAAALPSARSADGLAPGSGSGPR